MAIIQFNGSFAGAGIYAGVPAALYHADPCPQPSLSNSILQTLLAESPLHAWHAHPRLNPGGSTHEGSRASAIGETAHKLALLAGNDLVVLDFDSYRKKDAQEQRNAAIADGKIPILADDYAKAEALAAPLREAAENYLGAPMSECLREVVVLWQAEGFWRRALIDAMRPDLAALCDLKTTQASVSPTTCARRVYEGFHIQSQFYTQGVDAHDAKNIGRRVFGFIFAEQSAPHAISPPIELSEAGMDLARQQIATGSALWNSCLKSGLWPGYGSDVYIAEPPTWTLTQWTERAMSDERLNPVSSIERTGWTQ